MSAQYSKELVAFLRTQFKYNPDTGIFTWLRSGAGRHGKFEVGDVAGTTHESRVSLGTCGFRIRAHTVAYWFMTGEDVPEGHIIDHRDKNDNNNAWKNLRAVTRKVNNQNLNLRAKNKSGVAGVYENKNSWSARIASDSKINLLGTYSTFEDAVKARLHGEMKYYGEIISHHVAHLYSADDIPVPRTATQWRDEERQQGFRMRNGMPVPW